MRGKWKLFGFQLHKVLCAVLMIHLLTDECLSANPEGLALLDFRSRVEFDPLGALQNWNANDNDPCNWTGVHCADGKVVALNLKELSLQGTLSPALGKLSHLRALVLYRNNFTGAIPKEIGELTMLELLDLRCNMLTGTVTREIVEMLSLKHLLLDHNNFQEITTGFENPNKHFELIQDQNLSCDVADDLRHVNRKIGPRFCNHINYNIWETGRQKLKKINSFLALLKGNIMQLVDISHMHLLFSFRRVGFSNEHQNANLANVFLEPYVPSNMHTQVVRRRLVEATRNFRAAPGNNGPINPTVSFSPTPSGSFPAIPKLKPSLPTPPSSPPVFPPNSEPTPKASTNSDNNLAPSKGSTKWVYILIAAVAALFLTLGACICLMCRRKGATTIRPWKTGLSGQLQKAFVTGVTQLKHTELEAACEEFSNIIVSFSDFIIYKGTLSGGVEIAVVSTTVTSINEWTKGSEMLFRKKVEALSRINHKNFINLLGYCKEDRPFRRMMVLEYAPNGTLYEHLHVEEFEHLDWSARVRIIMGTAYCLQHIHELTPPVQLPYVQSNSVLVSEDFSAKLLDLSIWKHFNCKENTNGADDQADHPGNNVYGFGLLLLETVSGKVLETEQRSSLLNLVLDYLNGKGNAGSLVDSTLKSHKEEELRIICEIIKDCTDPDPNKRPSMTEVTSKLRQVIDISPEAATPRLSPLWWAELEILSMEAS